MEVQAWRQGQSVNGLDKQFVAFIPAINKHDVVERDYFAYGSVTATKRKEREPCSNATDLAYSCKRSKQPEEEPSKLQQPLATGHALTDVNNIILEGEDRGFPTTSRGVYGPSCSSGPICVNTTTTAAGSRPACSAKPATAERQAAPPTAAVAGQDCSHVGATAPPPPRRAAGYSRLPGLRTVIGHPGSGLARRDAGTCVARGPVLGPNFSFLPRTDALDSNDPPATTARVSSPGVQTAAAPLAQPTDHHSVLPLVTGGSLPAAAPEAGIPLTATATATPNASPTASSTGSDGGDAAACAGGLLQPAPPQREASPAAVTPPLEPPPPLPHAAPASESTLPPASAPAAADAAVPVAAPGAACATKPRGAVALRLASLHPTRRVGPMQGPFLGALRGSGIVPGPPKAPETGSYGSCSADIGSSDTDSDSDRGYDSNDNSSAFYSDSGSGSCDTSSSAGDDGGSVTDGGDGHENTDIDDSGDCGIADDAAAAVPGIVGMHGIGIAPPADALLGLGVRAAPTTHRNQGCSVHGPPWLLMPRKDRCLRFCRSAARAIWPHLLDACDGARVPVTLHVIHPATATATGRSSEDNTINPTGVTITPMHVYMRRGGDSLVALRGFQIWPLLPGCPWDTSLQISVHPSGDGAVVEAASGTVLARARLRERRMRVVRGEVGGGGPGGGGSGNWDGTGIGSNSGDHGDGGQGDVVLRVRLGARSFNPNANVNLPASTAWHFFRHLLPPREEAPTDAHAGGVGSYVGHGAAGVADGNGSSPERGGYGAGGGQGGSGGAAGRVGKPGKLPCCSRQITLIPEAWPELRFQVDLRYRFPGLTAAPSASASALDAPSSLASCRSQASLGPGAVVPLVLYGGEAGDVLEAWRRPGGAPDEFLCRVLRGDGKGVRGPAPAGRPVAPAGAGGGGGVGPGAGAGLCAVGARGGGGGAEADVRRQAGLVR